MKESDASSRIQAVCMRLQRHFETFEPRRPAPDVEIGELTAKFSDAPEELVLFLRLTNGLRAGTEDPVDGTVFSCRNMIRSMSVDEPEHVTRRLLPVRDDGCGDFDCLVIGSGPARHAVVFWDHEVYDRPSHLLAGSFLTYLEFLTDSLVFKFDRRGLMREPCKPSTLTTWPFVSDPKESYPWPHDREWLALQDRRASEILNDPEQRNWFQEP